MCFNRRRDEYACVLGARKRTYLFGLSAEKSLSHSGPKLLNSGVARRVSLQCLHDRGAHRRAILCHLESSDAVLSVRSENSNLVRACRNNSRKVLGHRSGDEKCHQGKSDELNERSHTVRQGIKGHCCGFCVDKELKRNY